MSELNPIADDSRADEPALSTFDDFLPSGDSDSGAARFREGLPSGYRMRADAHYVEQLESARPAAAGARKPATATAAPHASSDIDVLTSLKAISSCAALVDDETTGLTRQVATTLIRAESWRSTCVLQAARVVRQGIAPTRRTTSIRKLVGRVVESVEYERRLRNVQVDTLLSVPETQNVAGQEDMLVYVLSGVALLTIELAAGARDGSVLIAALPEPAGRVTLAISQDSVAVPESWPSVVGDASSDTPGNWSTPIALLALRRLAEAYGGTVSTTRFANGSRLLIELPVAAKPA